MDMSIARLRSLSRATERKPSSRERGGVVAQALGVTYPVGLRVQAQKLREDTEGVFRLSQLL